MIYLWQWSRSKRWHYLGYAELTYVERDNQSKIIDRFVVHFYVQENDHAKRRVKYGDRSKHIVESHPFFEKQIVPWLEGGNLWRPVLAPSEWLIEYTKREHDFDRVGDKWVKPAKKLTHEGNVIKFEIGDKK